MMLFWKSTVVVWAVMTAGAIALGDEAAKTDEIDWAALKADFARPADPAPLPDGDRVALGRKIFFETRLAKDGVNSCAACHDPTKGWEDGRKTARGLKGAKIPRHTPTIIDAYAQGIFRWDGFAPSLEATSTLPIFSPDEMGIVDTGELVGILESLPGYRDGFEKAFGDPGVTLERIAKALAAFQSTVRSGDSPFDRWMAGDDTAMSASAKRGFALFAGEANCDACHRGWRFADDGFHDIGLQTDDVGREKIVPLPSLRHAFKTPTLRDVARRAPYMHNGAIATLDEVVRHYEDGFIERPSLSDEMKSLDLSDQERTDLVNFMKALTSGPNSAVGRMAGESQ